MATDNALENSIDVTESDELDQAIDGLRGVLKKDAGAFEASGDESVDTMGGAQAFGSDFGADFADDTAGGGLNDPFNIGDSGTDALGGDFGMGTDFGASPYASPQPDLSAMASMEPGAPVGATGNVRVDMVLDIPIDVQIILGTSRMAVSSLMELSEGSTIALDRKIGEPVEIVVNGKLIGRGEITVLESDETRFGVRMIEVVGAAVKKAK
ncbi:flagellar motor switch protein FliN/FliY [Hoeflea marina]|uniref:Flagellar motor switch protein FliN n=1 Tax=Hoeflea marina TaxID=274592 RepID=A0A317PHC6_9HYPH|nr:flagellar motor switch protein FliN [Hoeflea marina]PWV99821.1 flagellar motor switch protein FliN/FliY [Hoeflea marina]